MDDWLAGVAPLFQRAVSARRIGQRIAAADARPQRPVGEPPYDVADALLQVAATAYVVRQHRPGEGKRACGQLCRVKRCCGPTQLGDHRERSSRPQACQADLDAGPAERLVDDVDARSSGQLPYLGGQVPVLVAEHVIRTRRTGDRHFAWRTDGRDDPASPRLGQLGHQQPHSAGRGLNQHRIARPYLVGRRRQVAGGHAVQQPGGDRHVGYRVRYPHHPARGDHYLFRV